MATDRTFRLKKNKSNQAAWDYWFRTIYPRVYYVMFRKTAGDNDLAQELAQASIVRFIKFDGLDKVNNDREAVSYLVTTASRLRIDSQSVEELLQDDPIDRAPGLSTEELIDLQKAVAALDDDDRRAVSLLIEGNSVQEIADQLGVEYSAMGTRLFRIREKLRKNANPV